jgi:hypothetical protein
MDSLAAKCFHTVPVVCQVRHLPGEIAIASHLTIRVQLYKMEAVGVGVFAHFDGSG